MHIADNRGLALAWPRSWTWLGVFACCCTCAFACASMKASQLGQHSALHDTYIAHSPPSCLPRRAELASAGAVLRAAHETKLTTAARCGCALALAVRSANIPGTETREVGGRKFTIYKVPCPMLCVLAPAACHVLSSSRRLP